MWKKLDHFPPFYLLFTQKNEYKIFVTDYISIWYIYFTKANFLSCLKENNILLDDIDEHELLENGIRMLMYPEGLKRLEISNEGNELKLLMTVVFGYPVTLKLKLNEGSKELFFQKVTQPLLKTINDLKSSQKELRSLLNKKDNEIEEYKCEGGEIALRYLRTVRYNDEAHMNKYKIYEDIFGLDDIPKFLLEKTTTLFERNDTVKQEPNDIKSQDVKVEPLNGTVLENQSTNTTEVRAAVNVKQEIIKTEVQSNAVASRKRKKKILNF